MNHARTNDDAMIFHALDFIDDRVIETFVSASAASGSSDLVVVLDVAKRDIRAFLRAPFEASLRSSHHEADAPSMILGRLRSPASHVLEDLDDGRAFWLVMMLPDGDVVCLAIGLRSTTSGGILVA
jgi:hypothetical protein